MFKCEYLRDNRPPTCTHPAGFFYRNEASGEHYAYCHYHIAETYFDYDVQTFRLLLTATSVHVTDDEYLVWYVLQS
jgi:hypothetical protein